jgi:pimeloyl-ACP methyl ester carboxylesterase
VPSVQANGIEIAYERFGEGSGPVLLLVHGLGAQLTDWDPDFVEQMVDRGFDVVTFDNRDVGKSTWFDHLGDPDLGALVSGTGGQVPYLLADLAADAAGLLDALGIEAAHVIGVSMGGMISQQLIIDHPDRVLTLTSIMSTPDMTQVGQPTDEALLALMRPPAANRDEAIEASIETSRLIGSPGFPFDEVGLRRRAEIAYDRGFHPEGTLRQTAAIIASPDRRPGLEQVTAPTLVIHGLQDPLVTFSGGEATAAAVLNAEFWVVDGMGHSLPVEIWPEFHERHATLVAQVS